MRIRPILKNRKPLIEALSRELGIHAEYFGAPTFSYQIGAYTVLRDGAIEVAEPDQSLLARLVAQGLIESAPPPCETITVSTAGFSGRALTNLVFMFASKGVLINKAIGVPDAFFVGEDFVSELKERNPNTMDDFLEAMHRCGGEAAMKGLRITRDQIIFTGFPRTAPANDEAAYRMLVDHLIQTARRIHYAKAGCVPVVNEKYTFRVWLNSLGMIGEDNKEARHVLLRNFGGNGSFRMEEQYRTHMEKLKNRPRTEPDFVLL